MSINFSDSVILITSSDSSGNRKFGTGFVIHKDTHNTYLLTCAHVVNDVGGAETIRANGLPATVIASGEDKGFDLAVLTVEGLWDKPLLKLCASGQKDKPFIISGFYEFAQKDNPALRKIQGQLGNQIQLASKNGSDRIKAWDLIIKDKYYLQPGYSGSPVIDQETGSVLGVVSYRIGKGEEGLAISIEALGKIWEEMPSRIFKDLAIKDINLNESKQASFTSIKNPKLLRIKLDKAENEISVIESKIESLTYIIKSINSKLEIAISPEEEAKMKLTLTQNEDQLNESYKKLEQLYEKKDYLEQQLNQKS
ncbi:MAG: trypsin-like peptidase domain-containing protein [Moorea sp. SIO1F2]|uniref:S1 family peptidase n=1 Tax=Moorena sp. SIO1F2 TaxID=2607819 RepID=UPI0013BE72C7|nr:serine protease [Moorena sp. SIO1F2]NET86331.1 trypsin-like peptidase domain-containing protein [Moorena sp. SIO1F2]